MKTSCCKREKRIVFFTQEVGWDWTLEVDVLGAVEIVEFAADEGVQVLVKRLQLYKQVLEVLLEGWRFVPRTPVRARVWKA